jgi:uncharacterized protein YgiM (DUF1202 family)
MSAKSTIEKLQIVAKEKEAQMETRRSENVEGKKKKKRKREGSIKGGIEQGEGLLEGVQSQHKNLKEEHDKK